MCIFWFFLSGVIQQSPTGTTLWMGGHDFITESGWQWTDGSPFRFTRWNEGFFKFTYVLHVFCEIAFRKKPIKVQLTSKKEN